MAGRGPAPAEVRQRGRDNKRTVLTYDGTSVWGDELPNDIPDGTKENPDATLQWHPMTVRWWEAWRRWPLMDGAHPVSWNYLVDTALMHHTMWMKGKWEFASEIRLREAKFGVTPADLRSLGYDYELEGTKDADGNPTEPGTVTSLDQRRMALVEDPPAKKRVPAKKRAPVKKAAAKKTAARAPAKKTAARAPAKKTAARAPAKKTAVPKPPY